MKPKPFLSVAFFALAASFAAAQAGAPATRPSAATPPAAKGAARPFPLKVCLVTNNDLDSMGDEVPIVYQGQTVKFCCKSCEKKFLQAPEKYLAKLAPHEAGEK